MRSYQAARGTYNFLEGCSKAVIGLGAFVFIGAVFVGAADANDGFSVLAPAVFGALGAIISMGGFYGLALAQLGRAGVDSAEYAQQSLSIAREQLEISKQTLHQSRLLDPSYATQVKLSTNGTELTPNKDESAPSYGNRPDATADPLNAARALEHATSPQAEKVAASQAAPKAIPYAPSVLLPDVSDMVAYKDGRYLVGGKKFWSRGEAESYARENLSETGA